MNHITIGLKLIESLIGGRGQIIRLANLRRELLAAEAAQLDQDQAAQNQGISAVLHRMRAMERAQKVLAQDLADLRDQVSDDMDSLRGTMEGPGELEMPS